MSIQSPLLHSSRTTIHPISLADAPFFLQLLNTPGWLRFIGDTNVHSILDAEGFIKRKVLSTEQQYGYSYYLARTLDGDPIGICGFMKKDYLEFPDFGFGFMPDYHGKGYGFEVAREILKYGINNFDFSFLDAVTRDDNAASKALLLKLGFASVGLVTAPGEEAELCLCRRDAGVWPKSQD